MGVDFDAVDAIETLERFGLWSDSDTWTLRAPPDAATELMLAWRARTTSGFTWPPLLG